MKKYGLLLCILLSSFAYAMDSFSVGDKTIRLVAPKGMLAVAPEMGMVYDFYQRVQENTYLNSNKTVRPILHYVVLNDVLKNVEIARNCYVAHHTQAINDISSTAFEDLVSKMREKEQVKLQQKAKKQGQINETEDYAYLEIKDTRKSYVFLSNIHSGESQDSVAMLSAKGLVHLNNKLVYVYCYASKNSMPWLISTMLDWTSRLEKENQ